MVAAARRQRRFRAPLLGHRVVALDAGQAVRVVARVVGHSGAGAAQCQDRAVGEEQALVAATGFVECRGGGPEAGLRVVDLAQAELPRPAAAGVGEAAGHEDPAVAQQDGLVVPARVAHLPGRGPGAGGRVVQLGGGEGARGNGVALPLAARDQHPAVRQAGRRVAVAGFVECAGEGPAAGGRVVELGGGHGAGRVGLRSGDAARREDPAVGEQGEAVHPPGLAERGRHGPPVLGRIEEGRAVEGLQGRSRATGEEHAAVRQQYRAVLLPVQHDQREGQLAGRRPPPRGRGPRDRRGACRAGRFATGRERGAHGCSLLHLRPATARRSPRWR